MRPPLLITLLDRLAAAVGRQLSELDADGIVRMRATTTPSAPPVSWVTGPVWADVGIDEVRIDGRSGHEIRLRVYTPPGAAPASGWPVLVFLHGGGWVLGNVANYDPLCTYLARTTPVLVVNVDYRLSPETAAPGALEDCLDALAWTAGHAGELGGDVSRLAIGGDSAGGNLATVCAQVLRDADHRLGDVGVDLACQVLLYPPTDVTRLTESKSRHAAGPILHRRDTDLFVDYYVGDATDALDRTDPRVSPLLGRHDGLPPTLLQIAGLDPLHDEGVLYAHELAAAGVPVELTDFPRAPHGFANFPGVCEGAWAHRPQIVRFLRTHLT